MDWSRNEDRNREIVRRSFERIWSDTTLGFVEDHFAARFVLHQTFQHGDIRGAEGLKSYVEQFRRAFPDRELDSAEYVAEDDTVAVRYTWHGTHEGPLRGIEPTGTSVEGSGMAFVRVEGAKCSEAWFVDDVLGLLQHLGISLPLDGEQKQHARTFDEW